MNNALDLIKGYGINVTEGSLENSKARLFLLEQKNEKALACLEDSRHRLNGAAYHLFNNHLLTAKTLIRIAWPMEALKHLSKALILSEENSYDQSLKMEKKWVLPFCQVYRVLLQRF